MIASSKNSIGAILKPRVEFFKLYFVIRISLLWFGGRVMTPNMRVYFVFANIKPKFKTIEITTLIRDIISTQWLIDILWCAGALKKKNKI